MTAPQSLMELREVLSELTPSQRTRIVRLCMKVGRNAGYCDDLMRVMKMMGFSIPTPLRCDSEIDAYNDPEEN